jgi:hypothetical protein
MQDNVIGLHNIIYVQVRPRRRTCASERHQSLSTVWAPQQIIVS